MDSNNRTLIVVASVAIVGATAFFAMKSRSAAAAPRTLPVFVDRRAPETKAAAKKLAEGDSRYASADYNAAKTEYLKLVESHKQSSNPETQDQVGIARLRLGYAAAKSKDFETAKAYFDEAAKEYKGTGYLTPDYGGLTDQAEYQSCVCIAASGEKQKAEAAFLQFIRKNKRSPLVHAAFRRLERLNNNTPKPEWEKALQAAVSEQERVIRFETSVCGPRAIEEMLKRLCEPEKTYKEIAMLAATTDSGTTLEGMKAALEKLGFIAEGKLLNWKDFKKQPPPIIWLNGDHYQLVLSVADRSVQVYDPMYKSEREIKLQDQGSFSATVLTIEKKR